jgi:hypothetical protein
MRHVAYPFQIDKRGRTAEAGDDAHVRDLIEQVLFVSPGERVNRPDFGTGLGELAFEPAGPELASAIQVLVQGALQHWLGDLIEVAEVLAESDEGTLTVTVRYLVRRTQEVRQDIFERRTT